MQIVHGTLLTCEGERFDDGFVAFADGKITAYGDARNAPADPETIDVGGAWIVPGFVEPHCHTGVGPEGFMSSEYSETLDPMTPEHSGLDAVYPLDPAIAKARNAGITTVIAGPGSTSLIDGQLIAYKTTGEDARKSAVKAPIAMKFALGDAPKSAFGQHGRAPVTRMSEAALLRDMLRRAREYCDRGDARVYDKKLEALLPLMRREIPMHVHASRVDDILTALSLAEEFGLRCIIVHCNDAQYILDDLYERAEGVILGPMYFTCRDWESMHGGFKNPAQTVGRGILTAICTDSCPMLGSVTLLAPSAALAAREGLDDIEALKCITINAAKLAGIDGRVGSIRVGKDADIAVFDKFPLEFDARATHVFIDGRRVK